MTRGARNVMVFVLALVMAGVASFAVYRAIQNIPVREVEVPSAFVVVAAKPLPIGSLVTKDQVALVAWPARNPVPGAFSKVEDVTGRGLVVPVLENEPITESKLAPREAGAGLPPTIVPGMRAISVKVNEVIGVAGFVVPGTRVDVLVAATSKGGPGETMARTVVQNIQVLSAGTRTDIEKARGGEAIPATVVTLMVTPEDAERITLASSEGRIMLALRNPLDTVPVQTSGARMTALFGPPAPPPVVKTVQGRPVVKAIAPPAPAPPKLYTVEAIRGAKKTEEVIK